MRLIKKGGEFLFLNEYRALFALQMILFVLIIHCTRVLLKKSKLTWVSIAAIAAVLAETGYLAYTRHVFPFK